MVIIGSAAINHWYSDFKREPKDIDYVVKEGFKSTRQIEYLKNPIIIKYCKSGYLSPALLLTLKASHLCWDISWDKHMFDVQFLLQKGNRINIIIFWELYDYWNAVHGKNKRSDLQMSKEDFFTNAVNYNSLEHDVTHTYINPTPIYTKVLKEGSEVDLDENKFKALSFEDKLDFVREEVMVMAYERYKGTDYRKAYYRMLKKFIISHVPLFALVFTIENYLQLIKPKFNYIEKIDYELQRNN
jgi:hypothetical protein